MSNPFSARHPVGLEFRAFVRFLKAHPVTWYLLLAKNVINTSLSDEERAEPFGDLFGKFFTKIFLAIGAMALIYLGVLCTLAYGAIKFIGFLLMMIIHLRAPKSAAGTA